jgi:hypothetical protein
MATLVRTYKLSSTDTLLPTTAITDSYTLCWILAALYSNSSVALNSVAGDSVDLASAAALASPTVVIAAPTTIQSYLYNPNVKLPSAVSKYLTTRTLQAGNLPAKSGGAESSASPLSRLRVLLIPQSTYHTTLEIRLTSANLHTLRTHLKCRIGYALTTPYVAGAVAQTNILDYRDKGLAVCVGPPLSSVEVNLSGEEKEMGSPNPKGTVRSCFPLAVSLSSLFHFLRRIIYLPVETNTLAFSCPSKDLPW